MQRAGGAMRGPHWPAAAALVIALSGCHAIYGGHGTPAAPSPTAAVEAPAGGSGATVGTTAEGQALTNNAPADWSDPQSGVSGRVRPLCSFTDAAGRACREYSQTVNIAGRRQSDTGIACRQSDGNWRLVGS